MSALKKYSKFKSKCAYINYSKSKRHSCLLSLRRALASGYISVASILCTWYDVSFSYLSPLLFRFNLSCSWGSFSIKNETDRDRTSKVSVFYVQLAAGGSLKRLLSGYLKRQCHEIFCFRFFSWITFPQAPENNSRVISNFFENSRRYTGGKFATGINDTGGKFCHQFRMCCWHRWQICHRCQRYRRQNLPPVSTTPVANCHQYLRHRRQICRRCRWHRWQNNGNNIRLQTP